MKNINDNESSICVYSIREYKLTSLDVLLYEKKHSLEE